MLPLVFMQQSQQCAAHARHAIVCFGKRLYLSGAVGGAILLTVTSNIRSDCAYLEVGNVGNSRLIRRVGIVVSTQRAWAAINVSLNQGILRPPT